MSIDKIIATLGDLVDIHDDLIELSQEKTEIMKVGSIDKLQTILSQERLYVQALEKAEKQRQEQVNSWSIKQGYQSEDLTITAILEKISDQTEAKELEEMTIRLTKAMTSLKQQEQLNEALIVQSMQFVQLSLDMMSPTLKNYNYGQDKETEAPKRSVFDSKA